MEAGSDEQALAWVQQWQDKPNDDTASRAKRAAAAIRAAVASPRDFPAVTTLLAGRGGELLGIAAACHDDDVVDALVGSGAVPPGADVQDGAGANALLVAASFGLTSTAKLLLRLGADVDLPNTHDTTPLFAATQSRHVDTVRVLVAAGADVNRVPVVPQLTPLRVAIMAKDAAIVKLLLDAGAKPTDYHVHLTARAGRVDMLRLLHEAGASVEGSVCSEEYMRATPLLTACHFRHAGVVQYLVTHGVAGPYHDELDAAIEANSPDSVRALCAAGADLGGGPDLEDNNDSPLGRAIMFGHNAVARVLLECGADVHDTRCLPVLYSACSADVLDPASFRLLHDHGADVRARKNVGLFANDSLMTMLISLNKFRDPDERDEVIEMLLDWGHPLGCEHYWVPGSGVPRARLGPAILAAKEGHAHLVDMFCKRGADVNETVRARPDRKCSPWRAKPSRTMLMSVGAAATNVATARVAARHGFNFEAARATLTDHNGNVIGDGPLAAAAALRQDEDMMEVFVECGSPLTPVAGLSVTELVVTAKVERAWEVGACLILLQRRLNIDVLADLEAGNAMERANAVGYPITRLLVDLRMWRRRYSFLFLRYLCDAGRARAVAVRPPTAVLRG